MITEAEAAAYVLKQFKGRIMLTVLVIAAASFVLGAVLF